jgi:hypothetical protein
LVTHTHTINVASASAMDREKENDRYIVSVTLKDTTASTKPYVNLVTISKGIMYAIFLHTVYEI